MIRKSFLAGHINVSDLPEFDATPYLSDEATIAASLKDMLDANDPALLAAALGAITRARGHLSNYINQK